MNFLLQEVVVHQYTVHLCHLFQLYQPLGANCKTVNVPASAGKLDIKKKAGWKHWGYKTRKSTPFIPHFSAHETTTWTFIWGFYAAKLHLGYEVQHSRRLRINFNYLGHFRSAPKSHTRSVFVCYSKKKEPWQLRNNPATLFSNETLPPFGHGGKSNIVKF